MQGIRRVIASSFVAVAAATSFAVTAGPTPAASAACLTPPANLSGWWTGDGTPNDAQGAQNATLQNGATYAAGKVSQAFLLDGTDDFVDVADAPALDVDTGDFTISMWVNFASTDGEQVLIEKYVETFNTATSTGWSLTKLGGNVLRLVAGPQNLDTSALAIPTNNWVHVAARRDGNAFSVFLNGAQVSSGTLPGVGDLSSPSSLKFGHRGDPTDTPGSTDTRGFFVNGRIDEVQLFVGRALSIMEIQDIHSAAAAGLCLPTSVCGNARIDAGETCDDGNVLPGDGCDGNCLLTCGNGTPNAGEECDDGNLLDGDGCDSNCTDTGCGNGIQTSGETCDDGNGLNTDPCRNDCMPNVCGDGFVNTGIEICDDGNAIDGDDCDSDCTLEAVCISPPANLIGWWPGNATAADIAGGHNAALRNDTAYAAGKVDSAFALDGDGDFVDVADDPGIDFGTQDFTVDLWVRFDDTDGEQILIEKYVETFDTDTTTGWTLTKLDNDAIRFVAAGKSVNSAPLTIPANTWIHFAVRRTNDTFDVFMNGVRIASRNYGGVDLTTPSSLKFGHRGLPSDTPGSLDPRGFFLNGGIDEVHLFDRALFGIEIQAIYAAAGKGLCVPPPVCSNGLTETGEACDDGNALDGDGCETDCTLSCGNATPTGSEACDDGNAIEGDGCDSNCTVSACGNGVVGGSESCEDGNTVNGDGCDNNCTTTACGNGVVSSGETCDDGDLDDGDGCESDCTTTPVSETVGAGGTVTTDPTSMGATAEIPFQAAVTTPSGGTVSIESSAQPVDDTGIQVVGTQLQIEAPPATAAAPLVIVLTVDASAIPEGVDPTRLDVARDGVLIADCTGTPGTADPDPCIASRAVLGGGDVELTVLTSHASLWGVVVRGLFTQEQACANGVAGAGTNVAKAQAKANSNCLKAAAQGGNPDVAACVLTDPKVGTKQQKTIDVAATKCVPAPPFGFTAAGTVNGAAQQATLNILTDVFGSDVNAAVATDADGASCQSNTLKAVRKLFEAKVKLYLACRKAGLAGSPSLFVSTPQIATCFDLLAAQNNTKVLKSIGKVGSTVADKCGDVATLLPGACAAAPNPGLCLDYRVECRICQMFNAIDGTTEDCDLFDDGAANGSCP